MLDASSCQDHTDCMVLDSQRKVGIAQKSSTDVARLSVPPDRAERFLERLANLAVANTGKFDKASADKIMGFVKRFRDLFIEAKIGQLLFGNRDQAFENTIGFFVWLQPRLRAIWREPSPLLKEAGLMMLTADYMRQCAPLKGVKFPSAWSGSLEFQEILGMPRHTDKFLMVLLYALKHVHLLRYCANPDCKEPYFVARRASQIFCSGPCAKPAQQEAKRKWWNEHGEAARRKRLQKKRRGKHAKAKKA